MEFPYEAPKGFEYWTEDFTKTTVRIWIRNLDSFVYNGGKYPSSVWGFYNRRTKKYHAPINFKRRGDVVNIDDTTPYSAMQLNLTPLERAFL